jgi:hypothetical protein
MKKIALILCLIIIPGVPLHSQVLSEKQPGNWVRFIQVESGFMYPDGTIKESIAIRQNISSYYVNQSSNGYISSSTSGFILGLKWEYFNTRLKTGISTGLRYTGYRSEISGFTSSNADFFYLRYSMLNSDTKFARVKSITETNNFISIPLEIRYIPFQYKGFGLFVKAGIEFSIFNLKKGTDINFQDTIMEVNQDIILSGMSASPNKLYSVLYGSIGLKVGKEGKPNCQFEVFLPSLFLTKNNFTLTDVGYFDGFKFSILFPIKKKN